MLLRNVWADGKIIKQTKKKLHRNLHISFFFLTFVMLKEENNKGKSNILKYSLQRILYILSLYHYSLKFINTKSFPNICII